MLDLSDGIASDLRHILRESGVGATLYAERIPIHPDVDHELPSEQRLRHALGDGEDFELLLTTSPATGRKLLESPPPGVQLFQIGTIDADPGYRLSVDGIVREMPDGGWVHTLD